MWPKKAVDWLGVIALWASAVLVALNLIRMPLPPALPDWLFGPLMIYAPVLLLSIFLIAAISRIGRE